MIKAVIFDMYETLNTLFESPVYFGTEMAEDAGIHVEDFQKIWRPTEEFYDDWRQNMFEILRDCKTDDLYKNAEKLASELVSEEEARKWIIALFQRVPELTEVQERELHKLGRKVRKKFGMKPVRNE